MEKTAYIIEVGEYSDREVIAICFDEKMAKSYAKLHDGHVNCVPVIDDENYITRADSMVRQYMFSYFMVKSSIDFQEMSSTYVEPTDENYQKRTGNVSCRLAHPYTYIYVYVDDEEKAKKIARDIIAKIIAEGEYL